MAELQRVRVCGNCSHSVTSRGHGMLVKSFKCDIDMSWKYFDEVCKSHRFDGEDVDEMPPVEEVKKGKTAKPQETIDLGAIPDSIRPEE